MTLRISSREYQQRLEALQQKVRQRDLDLLLVSSLDSIFYLTGASFEPLERPFFLLVRCNRAPILLVPKLDQEHMRKAHGIASENVVTYWEYPATPKRGWSDRLKELIGGDHQIGVEPTLRREITEQLQAYVLRTEPLIDELRLIKSTSEIEMIRRAAHYADYGVERLLAASYFGATAAEGFAETRAVTLKVIREIDDWQPLMTRVVMATWPAPISAMPHSIPDLNDRLNQGPHVALVLTRINGYAAESERTYFTVEPSRDASQAFAAMTEARRIAFEMIRPGVACGDIDGRVNEFLRKEGYGEEEQRLHRTGHGFGLGNHEAPWLAEGSEDRLAENMVISIEPGIYLHGFGGFRHSDTVLVTRDGYETLTKMPTDLDSLVIRNQKLLTRLKGQFVRWSLRSHPERNCGISRLNTR